MCLQSGGLVQRALEFSGISTVSLGNLRPRLERVGVPRAAIAKFPRGATVGPPGDAEMQRAVLRDTLALLETAGEPGTIVELPYRWQPSGE